MGAVLVSRRGQSFAPRPLRLCLLGPSASRLPSPLATPLLHENLRSHAFCVVLALTHLLSCASPGHCAPRLQGLFSLFEGMRGATHQHDLFNALCPDTCACSRCITAVLMPCVCPCAAAWACVGVCGQRGRVAGWQQVLVCSSGWWWAWSRQAGMQQRRPVEDALRVTFPPLRWAGSPPLVPGLSRIAAPRPTLASGRTLWAASVDAVFPL